MCLATKRLVANADGFCHSTPAMVLLPLQAPQIDSRYCQRAVVQEAGDILDTLSGVAPKLGGRVAKDV
jgi:hypothetical protein